MYGGLFRSAHYLLSFAYVYGSAESKCDTYAEKCWCHAHVRQAGGWLHWTFCLCPFRISILHREKNASNSTRRFQFCKLNQYLFHPFLALIRYLDFRVNCFCQQIRKNVDYSKFDFDISKCQNTRLSNDCLCVCVGMGELHCVIQIENWPKQKTCVYTVRRVERNEEKKKRKKKLAANKRVHTI